MPLLKKNNTSAVDLIGSMTDTYFWLRWVTGLIAFVLPLLLWGGGYFVHDHLRLQGSMSAYYYTPMQDWFVGLLFVVAAGLYFYEGITDLENHFMTAAAIFAVGVAINPMNWSPQWWPASFVSHKIKPHGIFAVLFFAMIILSCWFCHGDVLKLKLAKKSAAHYKQKYLFLSALLVILPTVAVVLNLKADGKPGDLTIFFVECAAIWSFAGYWFTKSGELTEALEAAKNIALAVDPGLSSKKSAS